MLPQPLGVKPRCLEESGRHAKDICGRSGCATSAFLQRPGGSSPVDEDDSVELERKHRLHIERVVVRSVPDMTQPSR